MEFFIPVFNMVALAIVLLVPVVAIAAAPLPLLLGLLSVGFFGLRWLTRQQSQAVQDEMVNLCRSTSSKSS